MIADTTFLIDFVREGVSGLRGPARSFFAEHRRGELIRTSIVSLAEVGVSFPTSKDAWEYFRIWKIYPLHRGIADAATDIDREMIRSGARLGENDNWIAGFCRYYREPVVSRDSAFDRVPRLRRIAY
jgi:predicted nucleic acid-binding protein